MHFHMFVHFSLIIKDLCRVEIQTVYIVIAVYVFKQQCKSYLGRQVSQVKQCILKLLNLV